MNRLLKLFNSFLPLLLVSALFAGCISPKASVEDKYEMAIFGQSLTGGVALTMQIEVPRNSRHMVWIDAEPLLWISEAITRAELVQDRQGFDLLRLWLTPAGARQFETVTSRYLQRNLYFLYPLPDPLQEGKFKACCVGAYRVEGIIASRVLDVVPNASKEELEYIVEELNQKVGAQ